MKPASWWIVGGLAASSLLWAFFSVTGRWKLARFFGSLAAALFSKWGEARIQRKVASKLADAGFPAWTPGKGA